MKEDAWGTLAEEEAGEAVVSTGEGKSGVAVVGVLNGDDLVALSGVASGLEGDVDGFTAAAGEYRVLEVARGAGGKSLGELGALEGGEVVITDVKVIKALLDSLDDLGVAVAKVVGTAVEVDIDEPVAVHVVEEVSLTAIDYEVDAEVLPGRGLTRVPVALAALEKLGLGVRHGDFPSVRRFSGSSERGDRCLRCNRGRGRGLGQWRHESQSKPEPGCAAA